ncbi:pectate lyase [Luedemannella flava]
MSLRRRRTALIGAAIAAAMVAAAGGVIAATSAQAATGCRVTYSVASQWPGGFGGNVSVTNLGDALNGWTLTWSFTAGQTVTQAWNATVTQSGSAVTATNVAYNGALATNASASFGFNGSWNNSSNPVPSSFALNGTTCTGSTSTSAATTTRATTAAPTTTRAATTRPATTAAPTTRAPVTTGSSTLGSWPTKTGDISLSNGTISVSGTYDGGMKRICCIGDGGQSESQDPVLEVANGGTVKNLIIGSPAGDGIHCLGTCTIQNVWWEDVGEDAATFLQTNGGTSYVIGGGARSASDKVFQHNGNGTVNISGFYAESIGKLYRGCGNCTNSYQRHVVVTNVLLNKASYVAGINTNWGDTATLRQIYVKGSSSIHACAMYQGVAKGSEPTYLGDGVNNAYCRFTSADIIFQ